MTTAPRDSFVSADVMNRFDSSRTARNFWPFVSIMYAGLSCTSRGS